MIRTNLSTRPFYNERAVHLALGAVALVVLALTVVNLLAVVRLSRQNTVLSAHIREDRTAATELTRNAREIRQNINQVELNTIVAAAREANALIDARTFSWTALFNQLEATLPPDVMLASIRPAIVEGETKITLITLGRRRPDLDEFIEKLEATGAFENVLPRQESPSDDGLMQATIVATYVPETPAAVPAAPPPPAAKPAARPTKASASAAGGAQ